MKTIKSKYLSSSFLIFLNFFGCVFAGPADPAPLKVEANSTDLVFNFLKSLRDQGTFNHVLSAYMMANGATKVKSMNLILTAGVAGAFDICKISGSVETDQGVLEFGPPKANGKNGATEALIANGTCTSVSKSLSSGDFIELGHESHGEPIPQL